MRFLKDEGKKERLIYKGWARTMDLKRITWGYGNPPEDEVWRARRLAEFFPFVADDLDREDKELIVRYLDQINLPDERKEIIRIVCCAEQNVD